MNERIKELAEQAGIKFYPLMIDGEEYDYEDVVMDGSDDLKKFAKLIVQECMLAVSKTPVTEDEVFIMVKCHDQIEKHFGVKE